MSVRYHISPATGRPNICRAEKECPIGGAHYDNKVDARAGYEASQATATIPTAKKKVKKATVAPEASSVEKDEPDVTDLQDEQLEEVDDAEAWANQILREVGEVEAPAAVDDDYDPWADDEDEEVRPKAYSWD